jgi:MFS family permease
MGLLWMILVQCIPRIISTVVTVLAIIAIGFLGIIVISGRISKLSSWVCVVLGLILLGIAVMFACFLCFYRLRNKLINIFLDWSTHFLKDHMLYYLYPFIFIALTVGLIVLCMFQHLAYLSNADPTHQDGDIYLNLSTNTPLFILNLIEFVWGLQFLKDSCKFTAI